jgi:hypothetical protein
MTSTQITNTPNTLEAEASDEFDRAIESIMKAKASSGAKTFRSLRVNQR